MADNESSTEPIEQNRKPDENVTSEPSVSYIGPASSGLLAWFDAQYMALEPSMYATVRSFLEARMIQGGVFTTRAEKDAAIQSARDAHGNVGSYDSRGDRSGTSYPVSQSNQNGAGGGSGAGGNGLTIAVLSLYGIISPRASAVSDMSQGEGCSLDAWLSRYSMARRDPNVAATIVLHDSPGGNVIQTAETADAVYALRSISAVHSGSGARGSKPDIGIIVGTCASADFWIATQHTELVCCPTAMCGSIGVRSMFVDVSGADEKAGVKYVSISSPEGGNKDEGNPHAGQPSKDTIAYAQMISNEYYNMFISAVARGRDAKGSAVKSSWGEGRMVTATMAKDLGMIDRINTVQGEIDSMMARVGGGSANGNGQKSNGGKMNANANDTSNREMEAARFRLQSA